jgi:hypothetical protein
MPSVIMLSVFYADSVTIKSIMVNVVMLSVIMENVIMLGVIILSAIMLSVIMLNVAMLNVVKSYSHHNNAFYFHSILETLAISSIFAHTRFHLPDPLELLQTSPHFLSPPISISPQQASPTSLIKKVGSPLIKNALFLIIISHIYYVLIMPLISV